MALRSVSLRLEPELWDRVARRARLLGQSQTTFVRRALEQALGGSSTGEQLPAVGGFSQVAGSTPARSASARASVPEVDESPLEFPDAELGPVVGEPLPRIARRHWAS